MSSKRPAARPAVPSKPLPPDSEVIQHADELEVGAVLNSVAQTRTAVEGVLSKLSQEALSQIRVYEELKRAIDIKQEELANLHGKDIALKTIDELKANIEQTKLNWTKEQDERLRQRESEETSWRFTLSEKQKTDEGQWADELRNRKRLDDEEKYLKEQGWKKREEELAARENELKVLRDQSASFELRVKAAADQKTAIEVNSVKREYEHKMQLDNMKSVSEIARLTDKVNSLSQTVAQKDVEIAKLQQQLADAQKNAAETVRAALESASGRKALEEVRETLATQTPVARK